MSSTQLDLLFGSGYAAADQPGIFAWDFDEATGALTPCGSYAGVVNPSFLVVHPNGRWLYAVSETSQAENGTPGGVWALQYERSGVDAPLVIQPLNHQPSGGDLPCHVRFDITGQWLVVSNYGSGSIGVLPIRADGSLGEMTDFAQHVGGSGVVPDRQAGPHAHSSTFVTGEERVIVADLGLDQLFAYTFDPSTGKLGTPTITATRPGAGPRHMVFHPNRQHMYVANELASTVSVYSYESATGALHEQQDVSTLPSNPPESLAADIHISPMGDRIYVSNRGHNSIAVFDVGADGGLTRVALPACGGNWPRNFALAPGGRFILVANQYSGDVSVLPLLSGTAALGAPVGRVAVAQASCVQFVEAHD